MFLRAFLPRNRKIIVKFCGIWVSMPPKKRTKPVRRPGHRLFAVAFGLAAAFCGVSYKFYIVAMKLRGQSVLADLHLQNAG